MGRKLRAGDLVGTIDDGGEDYVWLVVGFGEKKPLRWVYVWTSHGRFHGEVTKSEGVDAQRGLGKKENLIYLGNLRDDVDWRKNLERARSKS